MEALPLRERSISVLLIEDDPEDTLLLSHLMAKSEWPSFRFVMECAASLEEGLAVLARGKTEAVLLDLMLPDSRGLETLRRILAAASDVPVVVLTGLRDEAIGLQAVLQGAQDYQIKGSIEAHAFKRTISYAVERHRMSARFRGLLEGSTDAMLVIDAANLVRYRNPAAQELLGGPGVPLLDRPFPFPVPTTPIVDLPVPGPEGERILQMRVSEIEWDQRPARLAVLRDFTELRRVEELKAEVRERRRMDKVKDEFMSAVSHEMRNPLTIIKAAAQDLHEALLSSMSAAQKEMSLLQYRNILRLQHILDHILDLSRLESGRASIRCRRFDPAPLIRDAATGARLIASKKGIAVEVDLGPGPLSVSADPALFSQIVGNLLDNALRFAKSRIVVGARAASPARAAAGHGPRRPSAVAADPPERLVEFCVADDGPGVPKDRRAEVFDKFVQIDRRPGEDGYKGTGLGLALCSESVKRQGGRMWVAGEEGEGARFHFTLPRLPPAPKAGGDDGN